MRATQDELEVREQLFFGGFIFMSNRLKPATRPCVAHLLQAGILVKMITGDHVNTAIAVAVECGILEAPSTYSILFVIEEDLATGQAVVINSATEKNETMSFKQLLDLLSANKNAQVAMTGAGFNALKRMTDDEFPKVLLNKLIRHTQVFARTKPNDKRELVLCIMKSKVGREGEEETDVLFCGDGANGNTYISL